MGVDAILFANESNECFYYGRDYNLLSYTVDDRSKGVVNCLAFHESVSYDDIVFLIEQNIESLKIDDPSRIIPSLMLLEFVKRHPNDTFFRFTDNDNPSYRDIIKARKTKKITWEELYTAIKPYADLCEVLFD